MKRISAMLALVLGTIMATVLGTTTATAQDTTPFQINPQRVQTMAPGSCAKKDSYLIPNAYLFVEVRNKTSAYNGGAHAKSWVYADGIDKAELQGLARQVQDDLIAKLRAAGKTVYTWDDVKGDVAGAGRMDHNPRYDMPTRGSRIAPGVDFVVAAPSDDQTVEYNTLTGNPITPYGDSAARLNANLIVPVIYFTLPQVGTKKSGHALLDKIEIFFEPDMNLFWAGAFGAPGKGAWCNVYVLEHGVRKAATGMGSFRQLTASTVDYEGWSQAKGEFAFMIDRDKFDAGVLRVGHAFNDLILDKLTRH